MVEKMYNQFYISFNTYTQVLTMLNQNLILIILVMLFIYNDDICTKIDYTKIISSYFCSEYLAGKSLQRMRLILYLCFLNCQPWIKSLTFATDVDHQS